ncbi:MAG: hypothetical protein GF311_03620 [Candidatus Lokiarchaeota archaeon]|nr:hypothetical protein [Candidatus Lokiarchaeota archaeon]
MKILRIVTSDLELKEKKLIEASPSSSKGITEFTFLKWHLRGFTPDEILYYLNKGISLMDAIKRKHDKDKITMDLN